MACRLFLFSVCLGKVVYFTNTGIIKMKKEEAICLSDHWTNIHAS